MGALQGCSQSACWTTRCHTKATLPLVFAHPDRMLAGYRLIVTYKNDTPEKTMEFRIGSHFVVAQHIPDLLVRCLRCLVRHTRFIVHAGRTARSNQLDGSQTMVCLLEGPTVKDYACTGISSSQM